MGFEWLNSAAALITAFGTLLMGIAALWPLLRKAPGTRQRTMVFAGVLLLTFSGIVFAVRWISAKNQPLNVTLTTRAWNALNKSDYAAAISIADDCAQRFKGAADREEATVEHNGTPLPPIGRVPEAERSAIFDRGVLNDLAACFFIKGEAANKLGRKNDAVAAYSEAARYKYARVFDPLGFFWSPSEQASDRLRDLQ
jgi:hypothetical protein